MQLHIPCLKVWFIGHSGDPKGGEYVPALQTPQVLADKAVEYVPGTQLSHVVAAVEEEKVPAAHRQQLLAATAVP